MKKIELSFSAAMSLTVNSSSGAEDLEEIENEEEEEFLMSDEDFEKMTPEDFAKLEGGSDEDDNEDEDNDLGDDNDENESDDANEEEEEPAAEGDESEQADEEDEPEGDQPSDNESNENIPEYEAAYKQLFGQPIKASGREIQLRDVNQARNLIEMGVDYNKKMQHMRPHMQTLKTLEKQGLLEDQEKLNLLLEAQQGKPEAIKRLIAQSNVDMLDLSDDEENAADYRPDNHFVSEAEVEIENALNSISRSPAYQETIDVMSNTFDPRSRQIISENPNYIQALNSDIESGLYPKVMEMVQYQRDVKAIPANVSDIEAYIATVQQMAAQEQQQQNQPANTPASQPNASRSKPGATKRRKAAMSGNRSSTKKKEQKFDPLAAMEMSDEDFMEKYGNKLL